MISDHWEDAIAKDSLRISDHRSFLASSQNVLFEEPSQNGVYFGMP